MGKYEDLTRSFYEDYEQPVIEDYIVGFSGLDPDRKIKPEEIDHEKLDGLLGGDFSGRYHLTNDQVSKFTGYQGQIDKAVQDSSTAITGSPSWLNFIGVGEVNGKPCIYLYVNRKKFPRCDIPDIWRGVPVKVKYIGKIRPA